VREPTLNRFFSIHFLLPFVIVIIVLVHLILLHSTGSSNPIGSKEEMDKIEFHQEFSTKDTIFLITVLMMLIILISVKPQVFIDPENMNEANSIKAPVHIQPEWYFLFAYAILRSIPSKLGGIVALISSITVFYLIRVKVINTTRNKFSP
jgi:ubiquinol-cytochrome c reductase cytochrome b subunit